MSLWGRVWHIKGAGICATLMGGLTISPVASIFIPWGWVGVCVSKCCQEHLNADQKVLQAFCDICGSVRW